MAIVPQFAPAGGPAEVPADGAPPPMVPPRRFRPLCGAPRNVSWGPWSFKGSRGLSSAQQSGLRYEAKAQSYLATELGYAYHPNPTLRFEDDSGARFLVPDGLYFDSVGSAVVFEVKSQHMPEAWWQLRQLYEPVVRALNFVNRVACVEVVKSFDPGMGFPEPVQSYRDLQVLLAAPAPGFKVLIWKP